ncbi:TetR/AcrR family transcriptional regulator [Acidobacterium sp. S8]|uniref:TetR/AcrR family transcriptional regulator n=1 Tax=Acidobacterium sp. S8 TaxID=1641854 RepID=UPI00131B6452|nr:TetR/AcrR family transcriptional regulator [Acidobacterium sp. S8]
MDDTTTSHRIADEALILLEEEGESAVSMRRVAQAVGITPMAIYHHFPSREALLNFVVDREFGKFLGYMQARPLRGSVQTRLLGSMDSYIDYAFERPRIFDYVFTQPRPNARRYPDDFRARRSPTLNPIADLVAEAMKSGYLKRDDVWEIALELWAHAHGYVTLYRGGRFHLSETEFRALVRRSLRRLLHGLKAE